MAQLVTDCPRCGARHTTFDVEQAHYTHSEYGWQRWYEAFSVCRNCKRSTIFVLSENVHADYETVHKVGLLNLKDSLNNYVIVEAYINVKDVAAAGTMFRLCLDLATKLKLPNEDVNGLDQAIRRSLGLRLRWLFDTGALPETLRELSSAVKDDGNDGAHAGNLNREDADDLLDFTLALLERLYTEPKRLSLAKERRVNRREK